MKQFLNILVLKTCEKVKCGLYAVCENDKCKCLPNYFGNPYISCNSECQTNSECPPNKFCRRNMCIDPCEGVCSVNAICSVINHNPICNCLEGYTGNPYLLCVRKENGK